MEYTIAISIATMVLSVGISWGMITTKIKHLEKQFDEQKERIEEMRKDHDLIIRLDTKVDGVVGTLNEMKTMMEKRSRQQ